MASGIDRLGAAVGARVSRVGAALLSGVDVSVAGGASRLGLAGEDGVDGAEAVSGAAGDFALARFAERR